MLDLKLVVETEVILNLKLQNIFRETLFNVFISGI